MPRKKVPMPVPVEPPTDLKKVEKEETPVYDDDKENDSVNSNGEIEEDDEEDEVEEEEEELEPDSKRARVIKRRPIFSDKLPAIPVAAFKRLVREVTYDQQLNKKDSIKWEKRAFEALQVGAEAFVIDKFYDAYRKSRMCNKKTVAVGHFE